MMHNNLVRGTAASALALSAAFGLVACSDYTAPDELGEDQQVLASCPPGTKLNTLIEWDGTTSGASADTDTERLQIVRELARRTAVCGGHLTVSVFSAGSGATIAVYDDELALPGATDNARLRRVPEAVNAVMAKVEAGLANAIASLPAGGTDINGLYRLAGEQQAQLGNNYQMVFALLTDGMNNVGVVLDNEALSQENAIALADQVPVPQLPGAQITVAGLGRITNGVAPSELVTGLVAYYDRLCARTAAASCLSVTDWRG